MSWFPSPEQRSAKDIAATVALVLVAIIAVAGAWLTSQQRQVDHAVSGTDTASVKGTSRTAVPTALQEAWRVHSDSPSLVAREDGALVVQGTRVSMLDATSGHERWHYDQQREICGVASPSMWKEAVVVFRGPKGCGEVISFDLTSGNYAHTRDALAQEDVTVFEGNRRAGTYAPERAEIWRDDLVRTVEAGQQEAPHQPNQQKYTQCLITSAQTEENLLVLAQQCPDQEKKLVRLMKTTPEHSDEPEVLHEYMVPPRAEVIAASDTAALIYIPAGDGKGPRTQLLKDDGTFDTQPAKRAGDVVVKGRTAHVGALALWYDGERLNAYDSTSLAQKFSVEGALGTGAMMGDRLLVPVAEGIAVINPSSGARDRVIPVDRGGYQGQITLKVPGPNSLVEQREGTVVGLVD